MFECPMWGREVGGVKRRELPMTPCLPTFLVPKVNLSLKEKTVWQPKGFGIRQAWV